RMNAHASVLAESHGDADRASDTNGFAAGRRSWRPSLILHVDDYGLPPCRITKVQRVVSDIRIEVQIVFVAHGISLQGLSVLTRFFVGVGIFPRRAKSIRRASSPRGPSIPKNFPRSGFQ